MINKLYKEKEVSTMSYQEKQTAVSFLSGFLLLIAYCLYAFNPARLAAIQPGDLKPWAVTMLVFIAIGIGATIIIQIVFHVLLSISLAVQTKIQDVDCDDKEIERNIRREMVEDERDRLIGLKAMRFGFIAAGVGFVCALLSLLFNYSAAVMLNILFLSFSAGSLVEGLGRFYYYRKGI